MYWYYQGRHEMAAKYDKANDVIVAALGMNVCVATHFNKFGTFGPEDWELNPPHDRA